MVIDDCIEDEELRHEVFTMDCLKHKDARDVLTGAVQIDTVFTCYS
jgi:hypothetical protein